MRKFKVYGMSCSACSSRVERAVSSLLGVRECSVNLLSATMLVDSDLSDGEIIKAVEDAGYSAVSMTAKARLDEGFAKEKAAEEKIKRRLILSIIILIPLMYISMGCVMLGLPLFEALWERPVWIAAIEMLLSAALMVINRKFFISGFRGALRGAPNMDTLVSLGSLAAFLWSTYITFTMHSNADASHLLHSLYFESAGMILVLITVGKMLEAKAKGKSTNAIRELLMLTPENATVIRHGVELCVPQSELKIDDIFLVRAGERIAADGICVSGCGAVDESSLTGESIPADKGEGDRVFSGTINLSGAIYCRVSAVGEDTAISKIIKMVEDATAGKAPIAKIADRVSAFFVPIVLIISLLTVGVWLLINGEVGHALARGITVLVISCPCSLGLATPVAIMVGSGVGARRGILFKTAEALELSGRAKIVALDKTGTVTKARATVTDVIPIDSSREELLDIALSVESESEHPIARAICEYAIENCATRRPTEDFKTLLGSGVYAKVEGNCAYGGKFELINSKITLSPDTVSTYQALCEQGKTPIFFLLGNRVLGIMSLFDDVREDGAKAISSLGKIGMRTVMITGDNSKTANAIARRAGILEVVADVLPDRKGEIISNLSKDGVTVMVGDGINDCVALTRADVGMAIGAGTDIALESADVVLTASKLTDVVNALRLGRETLKTIHQNLFWAFFYNVLGIPFAAGVFSSLIGVELSPMLASVAMSLSSIFVVSNAIRLSKKKIFIESDPPVIKETAVTAAIAEKENKNMITKTMNVKGIMCPHCEKRIKDTLEAISGVDSATVSHVDGTAVLTLSREVENEVLRAAVDGAGYETLSIE